MEFGKKLKEKRLENNVDLKEVSYDLKISLTTLKYIEESNAKELPSPAFTKGFLRTYSNYLKVNPEEIVAAYEKSVDPNQFKENKMGLSEPFEPKAFFVFDFLKDQIIPSIALALFIIAGVTIFVFLKQDGIDQLQKSNEIAFETLNTNKVVEDNKEKENQDEEQSDTENDVVDEAVVSNNPTGIHTLEVYPLANSYMYIKTQDDESPIRVTLRPNQRKTFTFQKAEVTLIDAGATGIVIDGKDIGTLGIFGEKKVVQFPEVKEL